jgi:hypothetical protein
MYPINNKNLSRFIPNNPFLILKRSVITLSCGGEKGIIGNLGIDAIAFTFSHLLLAEEKVIEKAGAVSVAFAFPFA